MLVDSEVNTSNKAKHLCLPSFICILSKIYDNSPLPSIQLDQTRKEKQSHKAEPCT